MFKITVANIKKLAGNRNVQKFVVFYTVMPIVVESVSLEKFLSWLQEQ